MHISKCASRAAIAVALCAPGLAVAQTPAPAAAEPQAEQPQATPKPGNEGVEDIIVTAQRREERLQDVPISVTAVTGASLARSGVIDTRQLTQTMPSVVFSRVNTAFQPFIRGIGTRNANSGDESNVSLYIDGVYQPLMSSLGFDLVNIERIEVLRGPQGTLFGRNSTGGLINIITPNPQQKFSGQIIGRLASYHERSLQGYVTGGLTPTLSIGVTGSLYRDNGYVKDLLRGGFLGDRHSEVARVKIMFEPSDRFRAILTGNYAQYSDNSSNAAQALNGNSTGNRAPFPIIATRPWESAIDQYPASTSNTKSASLQTRFRFNSFDIETTSGYVTNRALTVTDSDATPKPIAANRAPQSGEYLSNEIRALSTDSGRFSWIVGGYQFSGHAGFDALQTFANNVLTSTSYTYQETRALAAFGEGTLRLGEHLSLVAGARYSSEHRNYTARNLTTLLVPLSKNSNDKITYRLTAQYKFSENANIFANYSRGFKSGVFNGFALTPAQAAPTRPETLDSYEIGIKTDPLNWLRVNGSVFHYDYSDIQQSARDPLSGLVLLFNAASAKVDGAELEATVRVGGNLNIRSYATYVKAKFTSFPTAQIFRPSGLGGNISIAPYDASGKDLVRAPRATFGFNFDWRKDVGFGEVGLAGNVFRSAKYFWDFENRIAQPAYTMINGDVSFSPAGLDGLRFGIFVRNLTNTVVLSQVTSTATADNIGFERPRTWGGSIAFKF